jgi:hypothetical protein
MGPLRWIINVPTHSWQDFVVLRITKWAKEFNVMPVTVSEECNILSRVGVTVDGVWIGRLIAYSKVLTTMNYNTLQITVNIRSMT